jgi:hypothetical protein
MLIRPSGSLQIIFVRRSINAGDMNDGYSGSD